MLVRFKGLSRDFEEPRAYIYMLAVPVLVGLWRVVELEAGNL